MSLGRFHWPHGYRRRCNDVITSLLVLATWLLSVLDEDLRVLTPLIIRTPGAKWAKVWRWIFIWLACVPGAVVNEHVLNSRGQAMSYSRVRFGKRLSGWRIEYKYSYFSASNIWNFSFLCKSNVLPVKDNLFTVIEQLLWKLVSSKGWFFEKSL